MSLFTWVEWSVLTFPIAWLARRNPLWQAVTPKRLIIHGVAAVVAPLAHLTIYLLVTELFVDPGGDSMLAHALSRLPRHLFFGIMLYTVITTLAQLLDSREASAREEERDRRMREELARTALAAAIARVQPEWFLRMLTAAEDLMESEPGRGEAIVYRLADVLRLTLERMRLDRAPIELDVRIASAYAAAESVRLGFPIDLSAEIESAASRHTLPPGLIPFVLDALLTEACAPVRFELIASETHGSPHLSFLMEGGAVSAAEIDRLLRPLAGCSLNLHAEDRRIRVDLQLEGPQALAEIA